jgi:hypothetical protein
LQKERKEKRDRGSKAEKKRAHPFPAEGANHIGGKPHIYKAVTESLYFHYIFFHDHRFTAVPLGCNL